MDYRIDFIEPSADLNQSLDRLGQTIGVLYQECWDTTKRKLYNKNFNLNIGAFTQMWVAGGLKLFVAYDGSNAPVGFLVAIIYRPMSYDGNVFQIEDVYAKEGHTDLIQQLLDNAMQAVRFIGCDEVRISGMVPNLTGWKVQGSDQIYRLVKG